MYIILTYTVKSLLKDALLFNFRISESASIQDTKKIYVVKIPWNPFFARFYSRRACISDAILLESLRYNFSFIMINELEIAIP